MSTAAVPPGPWLVYDGDCPFCSRYVDYVETLAAVPGLALISARAPRAEVAAAIAAGFDLDRVMVLRLEERWFAGEAAMAELARRARRHRRWNHLVARVLSLPAVGAALYRVLVTGRLLTLRLLGRSKIMRR
jgi:predicted DCC family thiol-disulfide oxidoreductase YuxK